MSFTLREADVDAYLLFLGVDTIAETFLFFALVDFPTLVAVVMEAWDS